MALGAGGFKNVLAKEVTTIIYKQKIDFYWIGCLFVQKLWTIYIWSWTKILFNGFTLYQWTFFKTKFHKHLESGVYWNVLWLLLLFVLLFIIFLFSYNEQNILTHFYNCWYLFYMLKLKKKYFFLVFLIIHHFKKISFTSI